MTMKMLHYFEAHCDTNWNGLDYHLHQGKNEYGNILKHFKAHTPSLDKAFTEAVLESPLVI